MPTPLRLLLISLAALVAGAAPFVSATEPGVCGDKPAEPAVAAAPEPVAIQPSPPADRRIFGVLPNYKTVNGTGPVEPLTVKQKFGIASKDSFDWPVIFVSGAFAGISHLQDQNPSFGQGVRGLGRRWGTAYLDQAVGNLWAEAVIPSLSHEDPRYFRKGSGSGLSRTGYALSRIFVTRTDSGGQSFNYSEFVGNGVTAATANLYYADGRTVHDNVLRLGVLVATDAFGNVLKEFWPDMKRKLFAHRSAVPSTGD